MVKLNRVALKDAAGLKAPPRRRRSSRSLSEVAADTRTREDGRRASVKDAASVHGASQPVRSLLTDQMCTGNVTDGQNATGGEPGHSHVGTDRHTHPRPAGLACSEETPRGAGTASRCGLHGDYKYSSPLQKTLGKQGRKSGGPRPEQSAVELKLMKGNPVTETPKKILISIRRYPKVMLCDLAQQCDVCCQNCGYVLPDVLKTKVVHCFKQALSGGLRLGPICIGHEKPKSEESSVAKNSKVHHGVRSVCQCKRPNEQQTHLSLSAPTANNFLKGRTSEASATWLASLSLGKCKTESRIDMWDKSVEDPGSRCDLVGANTHRDKRMKLGDSVRDESLACTPHAESISCNDTARAGFKVEEKSCSGMSDSKLFQELSFGSFSACRSAASESRVHRNPQAQTSPQRLRRAKEVEEDDPESLTCQRVRVYCRKTICSCARTYMSWPFPNGGRAAACPVTLAQPAAPNSSDSPAIPDGSGSPAGASSDTTCREEQKEDGERVTAGRNGGRSGDESSCTADSENAAFAPHVTEAEGSLCSSRTATTSTPSRRGREPASDRVSANSSACAPSPSAPGSGDPETPRASSPSSSLLLEKLRGAEVAVTRSRVSCPASSSREHVSATRKAAEKPSFHLQQAPVPSFCSPPLPSHDSHSSYSLLPRPRDEQAGDEEILARRSPPKLEPYYLTRPFNRNRAAAFGKDSSPLRNLTRGLGVQTHSNEFMLMPLLSPVTSPQGRSRASFLAPSRRRSDEEEEEASEYRMSPGRQVPHIGNDTRENGEELVDQRPREARGHAEMAGVSWRFRPLNVLSAGDAKGGVKGESPGRPGHKNDVEQGGRSSEQVPSAPEIKADLSSGAPTEPCSSLSCDEGSGPLEMAGSGRADTILCDTQPCPLDEFTAYERDILLVDVIQDDLELYDNLPAGSLLKLGIAGGGAAPKSRPTGAAPACEPRLTPATADFHCSSPDLTGESDSRPWRPQSSGHPSGPAADEQTGDTDPADANNNHVNAGLERCQPVQQHNVPPPAALKNGPWTANPANKSEYRRQKSNAYCWQYFSESLSCGFKMCRFQHVPVEGDEKFCVETVTRFIRNPLCLQKAGAVFTGYYQNNPPGVFFSMPVLMSLLWSLLKAGMVSDIFSVLGVSLVYDIVPGHEFLLALFNFVREKGLNGSIPELMQLTFKMASAGLVLSLDCFDSVKNIPEFQQAIHPNSPASVSGNHKVPVSAPFPEYLNLAHFIVEIELCTKQEDWRQMGEVFRSICQSSQHPIQVEQISGRIAIALLSESKDKLSLPFAAFAETVCQSECEDVIIWSCFGRIGVSLMLRYHKTHQWAKGRRVVEVLSASKVGYSTLKGLFGNEDRASRCCLVTVAAELFLLSGSVEGALHTLRENKWFLSSPWWPCNPADLESRGRVLMRLAEKTSHRDTLEVLCNLPGVKEPHDSIDISRYGPLLKSHLRVCLDRQILPVASDTVDFMLSRNLTVDRAMLQLLLHKLGKQNLWLRAREIFRHSLSVGYYPAVSAPHGLMALIVPCHLGEVELALTFEMFITVNAAAVLPLSEATTSCLSITLKRSQSGESEYLLAGSRLLSAACIPQPKLTVRFTAVNASQEQVFVLDISSARRWLRHNHLWAGEVWTR